MSKAIVVIVLVALGLYIFKIYSKDKETRIIT